MSFPLNSGIQEPFPCHKWHLPVDLLCRVNLQLLRRHECWTTQFCHKSQAHCADTIHNTDVSTSLSGRDDYRSDADVSLSVGLCS